MLERQTYIFLLHSPQPAEARAWLTSAYASLQRPPKAPRFLRRFPAEGREEIRRLHTEPLKPLGNQLYLGSRGRLYKGQAQLLRRVEGGRAEDYKFEYRELSPAPPVFEHLRQLLAPQLRQAATRWWPDLTFEQRRRALALGADGRSVAAMLERTEAGQRLELVKQILDSPGHLRTEFLSAATAGEFDCGPEVFSWLLGREDWNRCPGLIGLARTFVDQNPEQAWELHRHPDARRRDHLLDLLSDQHDWLEWLEVETELWIREKLMTRVQERYRCAERVSMLTTEKQPRRRRALGWVLAHWPCGASRDRRHLKSALRRLEKEQRTLLRTRLKHNSRGFWGYPARAKKSPNPELGHRRI